jgi:hypothetical protein
MFDTGSCELWVAGKDSGYCSTHNCLEVSDEGDFGRNLYIEVSELYSISAEK